MPQVLNVIKRVVTANQSPFVLMSRIALACIFAFTLQLTTLARVVLVATLVAGSYFYDGFIGAIRALFASIVVATAVVAILVQINPQLTIGDTAITAVVLLSFCGICIASSISTFRKSQDIPGAASTNEGFLLAPLLLVAFLMRRWMAEASPSEVFYLFGSEDNAAWISVARGFANNDISAVGLTHPTAQSPAVGPFTGFVSFLTGLGTNTFGLRPHVQALETVRNCFALLILSGALVAGSLVTHVRIYQKQISMLQLGIICLLAVVAESMLLTSLFSDNGFLSYMGAIIFGLLIFDYSVNHRVTQSNSPFIFTIVIVLLALGLSSHWWGTAPVGASIVLLVTYRYIRDHFAWRMSSYVLIGAVLLLSVAVLNQLRTLIVGNTIPTWVFAATGTVPLPSPLAIVTTLVAVALVIDHQVLRSSDSKGKISIGEQLLVVTSIYAMTIWATSVIRTGYENYAANKIVYMLLPLSAPLWFMLALRMEKRQGLSANILWPSTVFFTIALLSSSWIHFQGPQVGKVSVLWQEQIIKALDADSDAIVLCLHSNDENRIAAYVCSRFAQGLSRSESVLSSSWLNAVVYPDRTPNGIMVPEEQTSGGRAVIELRKTLAEGQRNVSIVVFPDTEFEPSSFEWNEQQFWWLKDVPWQELTIVR